MSPGGASLSVLMVSPQFRPLIGGYEKAAERLSASLADAGLRVMVVTERRDPAWPAVERSQGFEVRRLPCVFRRHLHAITSLASLAAFLMRHGRDFHVWHVHQYGRHAAVAVAAGKLLRRPVVIKSTSTGALGIEKALGAGPGGRILGFFHRRADGYIATSGEAREEAIRFGVPPERIQVIPNGVDGRQFRRATPDERGAARRELGLECELLVVFVGRLAAVKNALGLLDAWAAIDPEARRGALLAVVGDGPESAQVHARVREAALARSVHMAGARDDVETWYRAADFAVIASHREGLSNAMVEALASGLPIVSTRVSGSSLLLESPAAGIVVDVGDVQQLAAAMQSLLRDFATRERLGGNARVKFESFLSLDVLSRRIQSLYRTLAQRDAGGPCES